MEETEAALRKVLDLNPASLRALAREAGISPKLLRMLRDGERRLTAEVRDALVNALRQWGGCVEKAVEVLEAVDLDKGGSHEQR